MQGKINLKSKKINPSIFIFIIMVLILICAYVLFFEVNDYRKFKEEKHNFYYYFTDKRTNFDGKITLNSKDNIVSLSADNVTINNSPVYYKNNKGQVILPSNMEIVFPYKNNPMYKLGSFSKVYYKGSYLYVNSEAGSARLYNSFLYDGQDLYMFLEDTSVFIGKDRYDVKPLSYIEVTKGYVKLYDQHNDKLIFIENFSDKVTAYTDEYFIDLVADTFTYNDRYYLLIRNVDGLDFYEFK